MNWIKKVYRFIRIYILRLLACVHASDCRNTITVNRALIVAPHPDDEVFGCAGIIQRLLKSNVVVSVLILTRGENSSDENSETIKKTRTQLAEQATSLLGVKNLYWGDLPDGSLASADMLQLKDLVSQIKPDAVFIPHYLEGWSDHEATERQWRELVKELKFPVKCFHYCVWFWFSLPYSKFKNIVWKDAVLIKMDKQEYQRKLQAINIYMSSISPVTGKPYSGNLPNEFLYAHGWQKELFFEVK
jgi:Uncharacterized proteins, LmbE homologs